MRHKKSMIELPLFNSSLCFYSPSILSFALTAAPRFLRDTYNFKIDLNNFVFSARLAKQEDAEELKKILAEEERERKRKLKR